MISLYCFTDVHRGKIGDMDSCDIRTGETLSDALYRRFQELGVKVDRESGSLNIMDGKEFLPYNEDLVLWEDEINVVYCHIIAPQNEYEYDREDGIKYFFHTNEKNHLFQPHIHAEYSGEEIKIHFKDLRVEGRFKDRKKQKMAVEYVKGRLEVLMSEWHKIVG